ncbi:MAG: protease [Frankiaceae bacterium]|nr:protease [Frankiaceae bacterium]
MANELSGRRVAILAAAGVEQVELVEPRKALENAGATITLLSLETGPLQAVNGDINPGDTFEVDLAVGDASVDDFDALLLPGGVANPDKLRTDRRP